MKLKLIGIMMLFIMTLSPFLFSQTFVKAPDRIVDNTVPGIIYNQNPAAYHKWVAPVSFNVELINITIGEVDTNGRTLYNIQSNCSPQDIQQNPSDNYLHVIFMVAKDAGGVWNTRNMRYFYSTNGGTNWTYLGTVAGARAGYGNLTLMNDGRAKLLLIQVMAAEM